MNFIFDAVKRHPLARIYSAWKDKFCNNHLWLKFITIRFGQFLNILERKNMTNEDSEVKQLILTNSHAVGVRYCKRLQVNVKF